MARDSLSPSRESSNTSCFEDHCKAERTPSTLSSRCGPPPNHPASYSTASSKLRKEDVEAVSHFLPHISTWQAVLPCLSLADIVAPHSCPAKAVTQPRMCLLGTPMPVVKGTCGERYKREPHRHMLLSLGENGDTTAAKCADLSSGSGPRGPPSPAQAALSGKGTAAIVRQYWMLPCIHFGLMKAHSSEEKYLHSASQVVTFTQMTHQQAAPTPFSNPNLFRGLREEGSKGRGAAGGAE